MKCCAWYLAFTSVLMIGQYFLEKRFSRGVGQQIEKKGAPETGAIPVDTGALPSAPPADQNPSGKEHR